MLALQAGVPAVYAQDASVTGRVTNEKGELMSGATVVEKGPRTLQLRTSTVSTPFV